jgi:hypothetical protein
VRCCAGFGRILVLSLRHPAREVYGKIGEHQYVGGGCLISSAVRCPKEARSAPALPRTRLLPILHDAIAISSAHRAIASLGGGQLPIPTSKHLWLDASLRGRGQRVGREGFGMGGGSRTLDEYGQESTRVVCVESSAYTEPWWCDVRRSTCGAGAPRSSERLYRATTRLRAGVWSTHHCRGGRCPTLWSRRS